MNDALINGTTGIDSPNFAAFKADTQVSFIRPYDPKATEVTGYRHSIIRYRDTSKGTAIKPAKMVTIPAVTMPESYAMPEKAAKVLLGVIEDTQDSIIRSLIDEGESLIQWDKVTLEACLDNLTAVRTSQRLTGEQIAAWVSVALVSLLTQRGQQVAEAKGYDATKTAAQVAATINAYKDGFAKLAAPVPNLGQEKAQALQNMLTQANVSDDIGNALRKRLHAILNPAEANNGDL